MDDKVKIEHIKEGGKLIYRSQYNPKGMEITIGAVKLTKVGLWIITTNGIGYPVRSLRSK